MQAQKPQQKPKQKILVSLQTKQQMQQLIQHSVKISQKCQKFTKQIMQLIESQQLLQHNQVLQKLRQMYRKIFNYQKQITESPLCAKVLNHNQYAFKCFNCQNEDNSIICIQCFNKSNHTGHNYQKIHVFGGCCDCGDDQKWKNQGSCTDHNQKQIAIQVDQKQTKTFIKQMQYTLFIPLLLQFSQNKINSKLIQSLLLESFVDYMTQFNKQSMISNEMTFKLLKQKMSQNIPFVVNGASKKLFNMSTFTLLIKFTNLKEFARKLVDLYIIMFTRFQFKKYLTVQYNIAFQQKPALITSQFSNISCQIFTSHKIISQLIDEKLFMPLKVSNIVKLNPIRFEEVSDIYARYYIDLSYLSNLYNGIGKKYTLYHFEQGNINDITGYQNYVRNDFEDSIQYYGLEHIYFYNRCKNYLRYLHTDKDILERVIKDTLSYIQKRSQQQNINMYISKQRTLAILLFIYFNGEIQKAAKKQFLYKLNITYKTVYKILQAVLAVIRFYAINLSNRQTIERYYTFYAFCLGRKSRLLISIDYQLIKFCLLAFKQLNGDLKYNINPLLLKINDSKQNSQLIQQSQQQQEALAKLQIEKDYKKNITYQQHSIKFKQNIMPLQNLISLPIKILQELLSKSIKQNEEGIYDRKKALGYLTDYIGLMYQLTITNFYELNLMTTYIYNSNQQGQMQMQTNQSETAHKLKYQKQMQNFYGSLLKSVGLIKFEQFKELCRILVGQENLYLVNFVKQCCAIDNKKVKLKPQYMDKFQSYNLSNLKCMKSCDLIFPYVQNNMKENPLQKIPDLKYDKEQLEKRKQTNKFLQSTIFNPSFVTQLTQIAKKYLHILQKYPNILTSDIISYTRFVQQLIKLNYATNSNHINEFFVLLKQSNEVFKYFAEGSKSEIIKLIGTIKIQKQMQPQVQLPNQQKQSQQKKRLQQVKKKKLQKLKSKQIKAINSLSQEQIPIVVQKHQQQQPECMFCKLTYQQQPLYILCFKQKSNILSKNYLQYDQQISLISSCNHLTHKSCINNVYPNRQYTFCNYCKNASNYLLTACKKATPNNEKKEGQIDEENLSFDDEQQQIMNGLGKFKKFLMMTKKKIMSEEQQGSQQMQKEKQKQKQKQKQQKQRQKKLKKQKQFEDKIQTIAYSILYGIVIDYQFFVKSLARACCYLFKEISTIQGMSINHLLKKLQNSQFDREYQGEQQIYWNAYKFTILSISSLLGIQRQSQNRWNIRTIQQNLPKQLVQKITLIITSIKSIQQLYLLQQTKIQPCSPLKLRKLPTSLQELAKQIGPCKNCGRITNEIAICLLCQFKSCVGCESKNLLTHTLQQHGQSSIYVRVDEGWCIYVTHKKNRIFQSIYKNFMGEQFTLFKNQLKRSQYTLDMNAYNKCKTDIIKHRVQQQIRYQEYKTNKVIDLNP